MKIKTPQRFKRVGFSSVGIALSFAFATCSAAAPAGGNEVDPYTFTAKGWASATQGGRGGAILRVTNLNASGPGSLKAAIEASGPRIVVFEVGGVIDMAGVQLKVTEPNLTVAGQTAPSPGITVIKAETVIAANNIIIQHVRFRPGEFGRAKRGGNDQDGLSTVGAVENVVVDHCSFSWGTDENLSASGPRFTGDTPEQWRAGTSHNITYSHNLIYEGLSNSVHQKGEHSKGTLVHDNVTGVLLYRNFYANNRERNALFKGGTQGAMVNNLIFNPGTYAVHYNLHNNEWKDKAHQIGKLELVGNVMHHGPNTIPHTPLLTFRGDADLELYMQDNVSTDAKGVAVAPTGNVSPTRAQIRVMSKSALPADVVSMPAAQLEAALPQSVGARPWDRDKIDKTLIANSAAGKGKIIDSELESLSGPGYPVQAASMKPFNEKDWDLKTLSPAQGWSAIVKLTQPSR